MNYEEIMRKVNLAVDEFYARDSILLETDGSEWSVAHRIAVYLENYFVGQNIDCEYNRVGLDGIKKTNANGDRTHPDIIIHHRGMVEKEHNVLVIEIKIYDSADDHNKLIDFTSLPHGNRRYQYQFGLALSFKPKLEKKWFPMG